MYAALKTSGTKPVDRDLLNKSVKKGAITSTTAFRCIVGRAVCLRRSFNED